MSNQQKLTSLELETIAVWAEKELDRKTSRGEIISNPPKYLAWKRNELEAQALQQPETRRLLARYADAWGLARTNAGAYAPPIEDVPHPKASASDGERWKRLNLVLWRLPADHWLRLHAVQVLLAERRPEIEERTEEDEIQADHAALGVLAELELLVAQNADEIREQSGHAKPILKAIP